MPLSGKSRGGRLEELPPVNQLNMPPEDDLAATALELANLVRVLLLAWPLPILILEAAARYMTINQ